MVNKFKILFLLLFWLTQYGYAETFIKRTYTTKGGESILDVLEFTGLSIEAIKKNPKFIDILREQHPRIENWKKLPKDLLFTMEFPQTFANKYIKYKPVKTLVYQSKKGDSLNLVLTKEMGISENELALRPYIVTNIKKWNPQIRNWNKIPDNQSIYLEIPDKVLPDNSPYLASSLGKSEFVLRKANDYSNNMWSFFAFYSASYGTFNESFDYGSETATAKTNQISPATFGVGWGYDLKNNKSLSGSVYISRLNGTINQEVSSEKISIPWEVGANFYYNHPLSWEKAHFYTGLDYETFSTYNVDELLNNQSLSTREHALTYITGGLSKLFMIGEKRFLLKGSLSKTVISTSSRPSLISDKNFSGQKYIVFLNYFHDQNWALNAFIKQHFLTGPTDLTITRIGGGISYRFF